MKYIQFDTRGGFTGGGGGQKLYKDGRLMNITKLMYSSPEIETLLKIVDPSVIQNLESMFTTSVLNQMFNKPSNMSSRLIYNCDNKKYEWVFPMGQCPDFLKNIVNELSKI